MSNVQFTKNQITVAARYLQTKLKEEFDLPIKRSTAEETLSRLLGHADANTMFAQINAMKPAKPEFIVPSAQSIYDYLIQTIDFMKRNPTFELDHSKMPHDTPENFPELQMEITGEVMAEYFLMFEDVDDEPKNYYILTFVTIFHMDIRKNDDGASTDIKLCIIPYDTTDAQYWDLANKTHDFLVKMKAELDYLAGITILDEDPVFERLVPYGFTKYDEEYFADITLENLHLRPDPAPLFEV